MNIRVIQGNPAPESIAPYIELLRRQVVKQGHSGQINSILRTDQVRSILHHHNKHTQAEVIELHRQGVPGYGPANPVDESTHCLFSDGVAFVSVPKRHPLQEWQVGFDVEPSEVPAWKAAAQSHGWTVKQPYSSGSEHQHLCFAHTPRPASNKTKLRLIYLRHRLPRK